MSTCTISLHIWLPIFEILRYIIIIIIIIIIMGSF
jgi:hypothetical protein